MKVGCGPKSCETKGRSWPGIDVAVEKSHVSVSQEAGLKIVLIIDREAFEQRARRADKAVLVRIVHLPLMIVAEDELMLPPFDRLVIEMRRDQPALGQKIIERLRIEDRVRIAGVGQ